MFVVEVRVVEGWRWKWFYVGVSVILGYVFVFVVVGGIGWNEGYVDVCIG